jgi:hypothetical protein
MGRPQVRCAMMLEKMSHYKRVFGLILGCFSNMRLIHLEAAPRYIERISHAQTLARDQQRAMSLVLASSVPVTPQCSLVRGRGCGWRGFYRIWDGIFSSLTTAWVEVKQ